MSSVTPPAVAAKYDLDQNRPVFPPSKIFGCFARIMREDTVFNELTIAATERLVGKDKRT